MSDKNVELKQKLDEYMQGLSVSERQDLHNKLSYEPKIAFLGKTGVGKSSLTNAIFGKQICRINDIEACTRKPQEVFKQIIDDGQGIKLLDVPGIGENAERDKEYTELYIRILEEADMVLWVIKADDRTFTVDEEFYKQIVFPHIGQGKPFVVAVNQVDKMEPSCEWNWDNGQPGPTQGGNIQKKLQEVARQLGDELETQQIIAVSAQQAYQLDKLVSTLIERLPVEKRFTTLRNVQKSIRNSENIGEVAQHSLAEWLPSLGVAPLLLLNDFDPADDIPDLGETILEVIEDVGEAIADGIEDVGDAIVDGLDTVTDFFDDLFDW